MKIVYPKNVIKKKNIQFKKNPIFLNLLIKSIFFACIFSFFPNYLNASSIGSNLIFPEQIISKDENGCKIIAVGHFYSIQPYPELQNLLVKQIKEKHSDINALVFTGDITLRNSEEEWRDFANLINQIPSNKYFAPGNHEFINTSPNKQDYINKFVGYLSKSFDFGMCNLIMLNSNNEKSLEYKMQELVKGGGLDVNSMQLLKRLEKNEDKVNLVFMHHFLYSVGLQYYDEKYNPLIKRSYKNEKIWRNNVQPIIEGKVNAIIAGDHPRRKIAAYMEIDGIPYISNGIMGFKYNGVFQTDHSSISYLVIDVKKKKINFEIEYLTIPITSKWYKFNRNDKYNRLKKYYEN